MKLLLHTLVLTVLLLFVSNSAKACHALAVQNYNLTVTASGVEVDAESTPPTCGCGDYWLDVEIRCMGEAFDAAPFDPTQYLSLSNYPYFQSATMLKPNCGAQAYPTVTIPYNNLCPGITYQVRVRENNNGNGGPWSNALTFTAPGTTDPLVGDVTADTPNLCLGQCTDLTASVIGGCGLAPTYSWSNGDTGPTTSVCPTTTTTYDVTITEQCSNLSVTESVTVYVVPTPVAGTATANPTTVCEGETTNLTLAGHDGAIQWQSAPNNTGPWTNIANADTDNETSPPITADMCFRAVVSGCGPDDISNVVCVTVAPLPVLTVSNETICNGETTDLTSNVDLTGGTYLWTPTNQTSQDLTNVSPATTTTYDLEYTLNGCVVTESGTITVNPQPTTLNLTDVTICDGDNTTITATPDVGGGTFAWTPNVSTTNTATVSPGVGTNTYTIDYDINGCTYSESVDVIVNPVPTVNIADAEVCEGETGTLTANPSIAGGTYSWTPNGEVTASISDDPAATANYGVTYDLNGCTATDDADIIVHPVPVADYTSNNVCEDDAMAFNSSSNIAAPGAIQDYEWDINDNGTIDYTSAAPNHTFNGYGTFDVRLTVISDEGCSDDILQTVDVYPLPIVDFDANPLCLGSPTDFTDLTNIPNAGTITDWTWDFDDGGTSNDQNPSNTYANPGIYDVNLTVTTNNGCVDDVNNDVEIFPLPTADFNVTNDCFYEDINFQNASSPNATIFEWDFDDGSQANNNENPNHLYSNAGNYDVTLIIATPDGCGDTITKNATAYAQPNPDFTIDPVCLNETSQFTDASAINPVDGDVIDTWEWDFGDGNTSVQQNPTNVYGSENVYDVELVVTSNYGCKDSVNVDATVWPLPQVDFTPTDVCLETETPFQDQTTISNQFTNNSIVNWSWDFGDGGLSTDQNPTHSYQNDGTFTANLEATSNNGCVNDSSIVVTVHPKPNASFDGQNLNGCSPVCFSLSSTSDVNDPSNIVEYEWTFSDGTTYTSPSPQLSDCYENNTGSTNFYGVDLKVTTDQGCVDNHFEANYIEVYHNPTASFDYDPKDIDLLDPTIEITNNSIYADFYEWRIPGYGTNTDYAPIFEFDAVPDTHDITLITTTQEGCADTAYATVPVKDRLVLYVPNTFTPDKDDYNEIFQPVFTSGFDPFNFNMKIFDRWGEVVFETNNADIGWDGTYGADNSKIVRDGTYIWKIQFKENGKDKRRTLTGHVNVLK